MTNIAEIFTPPPSLNTTPEYTDSSGEDIMGKEDFLTLLVAQLQNQDPMNPDDPTEFTAQLAQFSSLEQLFNLNESMDNLALSQSDSDRFGTMELIGKDVVYADSNFSYDGKPVNVGYQLDGIASSVNMYIQDENGAEIATLYPSDLTEGNHFLEWDGLDADGNEVPEGNYKIVLQANSASEESTIAISPLVQSEVTGVDFSADTGEATLHTLAGAEISAASIIAVYQPERTYNKEIVENEDEEESSDDEITEVHTNEDSNSGVTGTSTPQPTEKSASTDEDQIEQEILQHILAG